MKYLIKTVETYRVANEAEAKQLIEESKVDRNFTLSKYSSEYKNAKAKGEIVDEWYRVILTKDFTPEKEPDCTTTVAYNVDAGAFPDPVKKTEDEETREDEEPGDRF
jgi:hypothetical protein